MKTNYNALDRATALVVNARTQVCASVNGASLAARHCPTEHQDIMEDTEGRIRAAQDNLNDACQLLSVAGASAPSTDPHALGQEVPLHLLGTDATKTLAEALESVVRRAEAVDRERGWIGLDGEGIGYAETLRTMLLRVEQEAYGARGSD